MRLILRNNIENIDLKETIAEVNIIRSKFDNYCSYSHLKDLYNKVIPSIQGFEGNIKEFNLEMEQHKEMIQRFDEVLSSKASKFSIDKIQDEFKNYLHLSDHKQLHERVGFELGQINSTIDSMKFSINEMNDRIIQEIKIAVK